MSRIFRRLVRRPANDLEDVWSDVAARVGGVFEQDRKGREYVRFGHRGVPVRLEKHVSHNGTTPVVYTRARALYPGSRDLKVSVRPRNVFDRLVRALGFEPRLALRPALLERYVVRGRPPARLPSLFSPGLTGALMAAGDLVLKVGPAPRRDRKEHGDDAGEITCQVSGVLLDLPRLGHLLSAVTEGLDALDRISEARLPDPPGPSGAPRRAWPPGRS